MKEELINTEKEQGGIIATSRNLSVEMSRRSELAQELISRKPDFLERWALFIFLVVLMALLTGTWFIRYPDIIEARVMLTAASAPKEIIPVQDGRLVKLFVHNNEQVSQYQMIGWLESTANPEEVLALLGRLDSSILLINAEGIEQAANLLNRRYNRLGEMQQGYQQFMIAWQQFNDYVTNGFYLRKRHLLENDVRSADSMTRIIRYQKQLTVQDVKLAEERFNMHKILLDEKVLSKEEFRIEKSKFVNKEMTVPQLDASLLTNETKKWEKIKEIEQLDHDVAQQKMLFQQALQSLRSQVENWIKMYVLRSPVAGRVFFITPLQENQYLQAGKIVGYINPEGDKFYMEGNLSQNSFGKVDTGFRVQLRFDAYPYQEMGYVDGRLNYISNVPSDSGFLATIRLDKGLVTNNGRSIPYKSGLTARAIIFTKDMRLLERFYYNTVKSTSVGSK